MNDKQICSRDGCGKEIDPQKYVSKGEHHFCSYECADWENRPVRRLHALEAANVTDWQTLPAPSS